MSSMAASPENAVKRADAATPALDGEIRVSTPDYAELRTTSSAPVGASLNLLADVTVTATAELGHSSMTIAQLLQLSEGTVIPLDRPTSQPVDIVVQGVPVARGEVTVVGDHFAIRVTEITNQKKHSGLARSALGQHVG